MLTHLTINDFMLIDHLDLQLKQGMTAITGETGTGKSVLLGALAMILGDRADSDRIRPGAERTDVTATFLLNDLPDAKQWLVGNDLCSTDEECLLRRILTKNGRSRAFINAQPVTLQQLKALGALLIDIHSQHAHQSLLSKTAHQRLLDEFSQHSTLVQQVGQAYRHWQKFNSQYLRLHNNSDELNARYQLLQYQVNELSQLGLNDGELEPLEREQQALANAESLISKNQQIDALCDDEQGVSSLLNQTLSILSSSSPQTESTKAIYELLNQALIYVDEARSELRDQLDAATLDPERLQQVEARLSQIYDVARKHRINTSELPALHQKLATELTELSSGDESLVAIEAKSIQAQQQFLTLAEQLSQQRQESARLLEKTVNQQLQELAMGNSSLLISVTSSSDQSTSQGIDDIEFLIRTHPGQPHKTLSKVASGGELSRISLAIKVATSQTSQVATLVFDEIDVGIGGDTADVVGQLLAKLGQNSQVLCVTHLAQVASKANHHWQVIKHIDQLSVKTAIAELDHDHKVHEIARMISGSDLSQESIAHARLMLERTGS